MTSNVGFFGGGLALLLAGAALLPATAGAEAGAGESPGSDALQEIVVTAQRREESLQRAALAVSAVTADQLTRAGIDDPTGLTEIVPALQVLPTGNAYPIFFLRGIGNFTANPYTDAAVTFNYDGVPIARPSASSGNFYDLERVEVLKGPQGILYGKNATGGAINVLPARPALDEFAGDITVEAGDYNLIHTTGDLNLPVSAIAAVRGAFNIIHRDGYYSDGTGDDVGRAGRVQFLLQPTDRLSINIGTDLYRQGGRGVGSTLVDPATGRAVIGPWVDINDSRSCAAFAAYYSGDTSICHEDSYYDNTNWGVTATINWTTDLGTLTVVPATREAKLNTLSRNNPNLRDVEDDRQHSVETRFASNEIGGFSWLAGVFYINETNSAIYGAGLRPGAGDPSSMFAFLGDNPFANQALDMDTKSEAAFLNLRYSVLENLNISLGGRFTHDEKIFDAIITLPPWAGVPAYPLDYSKSWNAPTWKANVAYDLTSQSLIYLNVERGYKAGGFFVGNPVTGSSYDPEHVLAYTLGSKNTLFDGKLRVNVELFDYEYKDQQISHYATLPEVGAAFITQNAGSAASRGVELETEYLATRDTLIGADVQYNNAAYSKFLYSSGIAPVASGCPSVVSNTGSFTYNCSGQQMGSAPRWTAAAHLQQTAHLPDGASLVGDISGHMEGAQWLAQDYLPYEHASSHTSGDLSLGYHSIGDTWSFTGFVNNFTNALIPAINYGTGVPENLATFQLGSAPTVVYRAPRTYGARISVHFK